MNDKALRRNWKREKLYNSRKATVGATLLTRKHWMLHNFLLKFRDYHL